MRYARRFSSSIAVPVTRISGIASSMPIILTLTSHTKFTPSTVSVYPVVMPSVSAPSAPMLLVCVVATAFMPVAVRSAVASVL